jgi:hypothetical protein
VEAQRPVSRKKYWAGNGICSFPPCSRDDGGIAVVLLAAATRRVFRQSCQVMNQGLCFEA